MVIYLILALIKAYGLQSVAEAKSWIEAIENHKLKSLSLADIINKKK